jgi:hypothetical protein
MGFYWALSHSCAMSFTSTLEIFDLVMLPSAALKGENRMELSQECTVAVGGLQGSYCRWSEQKGNRIIVEQSSY